MKKFTLLLFLQILILVTQAQKVYFIYLQSENQEQFYARIGEKILNSSSSGYLIIPKLVDSTYNVNIGVQESQSPEQLFSVTINKKDKGYLIKNFEDKGWGLFDLQTFAVVMPASVNSASQVKTVKRESDAFTDLLAKAADDSTIKEKPVFIKTEDKKTILPNQVTEKKEETYQPVADSVILKPVGIKQPENPVIKKEEIQNNIRDSLEVKEKKEEVIPIHIPEKKEEVPLQKTDSSIIKDEEHLAPPVVEKSPTGYPFVDVFQKSIVVKRSESSTTEGFGITFLDVAGDGSIDTVRIFIPNEKMKPPVTEVKREELKFLDIISSDTANLKLPEKNIENKDDKTVSLETKDQPVERQKCVQHATDDDFFNLRKYMAAETSNDNMINEAKKMFRSRCFTTMQIKYLSTLFLTDEGKYHFFDTAYPNTSDKEKFGTLQSELKEEYYINRFKAMLY